MSMKLTKTPTEYILEGTINCSSCKGTGLYKGFGETDGACVICYHCKGSGKIKITEIYQKFKERKRKEGCKRVYTRNMGSVITDRDIRNNKGFFPFSKYGCTYEEWLKGAKPVPLKFLGCPRQEIGWGEKFDYCTKHNKGISGVNCPMFPDKEKCWEIFDKKRKI